MSEFNRDEFNADILSALDEIRLSSPDIKPTDPDDKVFTYLMASMFENTNEDTFSYTDGSNDKGIDFFVVNDNSYKFYQCKSTDIDLNPSGKVFDATPVNELDEAISYILSEEFIYAKSDVENFKNAYKLSINENNLTAVLAIQGKLSRSGLERFNEIKNYYSDFNITVELIDENVIFSKWHDTEDYKKISDINFSLEPISEDSFLRQKNGWLYGIFKISSLLDAIKTYGNSLFDLNVRAKLTKSSVNESIRQTISTEKGQKEFIHLNNGLVIQCESYSIKGNKIQLKGAQVVNGCQTLSTIWKYYFSEPDSNKKLKLLENVQVFIRVFNNSISEKDGLLDKIIVASNNQNSMNRRNLKSNSFEQKEIQRMFYRSPLPSELKFFYIRKDGELDAFLENGNPGREPRRTYFSIEGSQRKKSNKYRHIDNELLAQIWWSWIGNSNKVNSGGLNYFEGNLYSNIFEKRPSSLMLENMSAPDFKFNPSELEAGIPSQYQFLLAMAFSTYFAAYVKPKPNFRNNFIKDLIQSGELKENSSREEQSQILSMNNDYTQTMWKGQMSFAITEVAMFLLSQNYGRLTPDLCQKLLNLSDIRFWLKNGMNSALIEDVEFVRNSILMNIMSEMIDTALSIFFLENQSAIMLDPRPKLFLSRRESIIQVKNTCLKINTSWKDFPKGIKKPGKTFFDTFPEV